MSIGKIIGNYKISQEIGHGGMGKVYKAIHLSLERIVAIKMIHPKLLSNNDMVARFYSEARIQAKLNHPNIVTVYDFFEFEDNHYIIMEFVEGESVSKIINHQGAFDVNYATNIILQILEGMSYAHKKNVIHKDIKTSNFILTSNHVKITDFGIAQIVGDSDPTSEGGGVIGTPKYMAPELILGKKIDHRADIYSLGISFYQLLTGRVPFTTTGKSDFEVRKAQVEDPPPPPTEINPRIPKEIENIILKSLSKNTNDRFSCVDEFIEAIVETNKSGLTANNFDKTSTVNDLNQYEVPGNTDTNVENNYDVSGRLEKTNFVKLLSKFHHEKSLGHLFIESNLTLNIYFHDGYIQFVECNDPNQMLGKLLVGNKMISKKDQESAIQYSLESGLKIGESLIKLGKITPHELSNILEVQLKLKLLNGFRCIDGFYGFMYSDQTEVETIFRIDPIQVIYEAVDKHYLFEDPSSTEIDIDGQIRPKEVLFTKIGELTLNSIKEIKLINMIKDEISINDIVNSSPLSKLDTFKLLKFLEMTDLISIEKNYSSTSKTVTQTQNNLLDPFSDNTVLLNESIIEKQIDEALKKIQ